jgi:ferredoxin-NADP reductase
MATYKVKLKKRTEISEGTMAFYFEKPSGFQFKAGQFIHLTLIDPPETDAEGNGRTFTVASAPYENDLMIATRMRDTAFKRVLKAIPLGAEVTLGGPYGSLVLHNDAGRPAVFLAGGIGITPFRSIILQATSDKVPQLLFLFYSNRRPEDAAFLKDLEDIEKLNSNYKFIGAMTKMEKSNSLWRGETGHINREMLARYVDDLMAPIYYIAGPPAMVDALRNVLADARVNTENVRAEVFAGYE